MTEKRIADYRAAALQCLRNAEAASDPYSKLQWGLRAVDWTDEADALERPSATSAQHSSRPLRRTKPSAKLDAG